MDNGRAGAGSHAEGAAPLAPGEATEAVGYGVSAAVVRRVLRDLAAQTAAGRAGPHARAAVGHDVAPALSLALPGFVDLRELARDWAPPDVETIDEAVLRVDAQDIRTLRLAPGARVLYVCRRRLRHERPHLPLALVSCRVALSRAQGLDDLVLEDVSLDQALQAVGVRVRDRRVRIDAVAADRWSARRLRVAVGAPLLRVRAVSLVAGGVPVARAEFVYPSGLAPVRPVATRG